MKGKLNPMKLFSTANVTGLGVLFLTLSTAPGATPNQNAAQSTTKLPPAESSLQAPSGDRNCQNLSATAEQLAAQARIIQQEMQKLGGLKDSLKWEGEMSSPQMQKLQALAQQYAAKQGEFGANAEELAAQAKESAMLVQQDQDQGQEKDKVAPLFGQNRNLVIDSDDGGGWLGVEIDEVNADNAKDLKLSAVRGVVVKEVEPDSPAAKAGLKENDVVTQYDGQVVEGTVQFRRLVRETPPGHTVALTISRDGGTQNLSIELGDRQALMKKRMQGMMRDLGNVRTFVTPSMDWNIGGPDGMAILEGRTPMLGISAEDLSGQLGDYFGAPDGQGILVREVRSGTPAEKAGLKAGDVIVTLDGKPVHTLSELREQLRDKNDQKPVSLGVLRKGATISLPVTVEKPRPSESIQVIHRAQL